MENNRGSGVGAIFGVSCLVAGNLLGAGILGLPINTGLSGVLPSFLGMVVFCVAMYFSAVVLAREAISEKRVDFNFPSLYRRHIGSAGKWIAIPANLLILYGLLTAYLTGATSILVNQLHIPGAAPLVLLVVFLLLSGMTLLNVAFIQKYNAVLMAALAASFILLVVYAGREVQPERFLYTDWLYLPAAVPIILCAFHFHNIIPTICHSLAWNEKAVRRTMAAGMLLGFLMNAIWVVVGVGALPLVEGGDSLRFAFENSLPVTVPLGHQIHSPVFTFAAMGFALVAIVTSFIANGLGLLGFVGDFTKNFLRVESRALVAALSFLPPCLVALFFPDIFLKAIDLVGGIGIAILFGILPAVIAFRHTGTIRRLALPMLLLFSIALVFEVLKETGVTHMDPDAVRAAENWRHNLENHPPRPRSQTPDTPEASPPEALPRVPGASAVSPQDTTTPAPPVAPAPSPATIPPLPGNAAEGNAPEESQPEEGEAQGNTAPSGNGSPSTEGGA